MLSLSQEFEKIAEIYPDNDAIVYHDQTIRYAELNRFTNQFARYLQNLTLIANNPQCFVEVSATIRIGIYLPQSPAITQSILAVLKAGYAFVPFSTDAEVSQERLIFLLNKVEPQVLITSKTFSDKSIIAQAQQQNYQILFLEDVMTHLEILPDHNLDNSVYPTQLAYIFPTSGSTGMPKAVMIPHRNLVACMHSGIDALGVTASSHVAQLASIGFDASLMEIFIALLTGAALYLIPRDKNGLLDLSQLNSFYRKKAIDVSIVTPSVLNLMDSYSLPYLRLIYTGEPGDAGKWKNAKNGYGITECTIGGTIDGAPMKGVNIHILKRKKLDSGETKWELAEENERGEIFFSGDAVGLGYYADQWLSQQRFFEIDHPVESAQKLKIYRTGDIGYKNAEQKLIILGRRDRQAKVHGKLICPEEIEAQLMRYKNGTVFQAVYVDTLSDLKPPVFLAFLIVKELQSVDVDLHAVNSFLRKNLTETMIPSRWVIFPHDVYSQVLNANKKIHRDLLKKKWQEDQVPIRFCQGFSPVAIENNPIVSIWRETLNLDQVSDYICKQEDNFFDLGGTSVQYVHLLRQLEKNNLKIALNDFRNNPTLGYLLRCALWEQNPCIPLISCLKGNHDIKQLLPSGVIPIFLLHSLVGDTNLDYVELIRECNDKIIFGINACGLTHPELMGTTFHEMAQHILVAIDKVYQGDDYFLAGWSGGGLLALALQNLLEEKNKKTHIILFDTVSTELLQNMNPDSFQQFLRSLIEGNDENKRHSIKSRHKIDDKILKQIFSKTDFSVTKNKILYSLFLELQSSVEKIEEITFSEKKDIIGLLTTIEKVLQAGLQFQTPKMVKNATLIAASKSQKRYECPRLGWPKSWDLAVKTVEGDHFFMLDSYKLRQLNINLLFDRILAELKIQPFVKYLYNIKYKNSQYSCIRHPLGILEDEYLKLQDCYVNLIIVDKKEGDNHYGKKENTLRNTILNDYEDVFSLQENELLLFENFFQTKSKNQGLRRKILVTGRAGSGKSILCNKIVSAVINEGLWPEIKIVLLISLRELNGKNKINSFSDIIHYVFNDPLESFSFSFEKIKKSLSFLSDNVLFILDGFDELDRESRVFKIVNEFIENTPYRLLVTSRPLRCPSPRFFDFHVANIGFSHQQINDFILKFFKNEEKSNLVCNFIYSNPNILGLAHTPILLSIICAAYEEVKEKNKKNKSLTMTEIYSVVVNKILSTYLLNRPGEKKARNYTGELSNVPDDILEYIYQDELTTLQCYAFAALEQGKIILDEDLLNNKKLRTQIQKKLNKPAPLPEKLIELGFLQAEKIHNRIKTCSFIHLTLHEFFAAQCWVKQFIAKEEDAYQFLITHKYDAKFEIFWWFVAGILAKEDPDQYQDFIYKILAEPYDLLGLYSVPLLMRCLDEGSVEEGCVMPVIQRAISEYLLQCILKDEQFFIQEKMLRYLKQCPSLICYIKDNLVDKFIISLKKHDYTQKKLFKMFCNILDYTPKTYATIAHATPLPCASIAKTESIIADNRVETPLPIIDEEIVKSKISILKHIPEKSISATVNKNSNETILVSPTEIEIEENFNKTISVIQLYVQKQGEYINESFFALKKIKNYITYMDVKQHQQLFDLLLTISENSNTLTAFIWHFFRVNFHLMDAEFKIKMLQHASCCLNTKKENNYLAAILTLFAHIDFDLLDVKNQRDIIQFCFNQCQHLHLLAGPKNNIKTLSLIILVINQHILSSEENDKLFLFFQQALSYGILRKNGKYREKINSYIMQLFKCNYLQFSILLENIFLKYDNEGNGLSFCIIKKSHELAEENQSYLLKDIFKLVMKNAKISSLFLSFVKYYPGVLEITFSIFDELHLEEQHIEPLFDFIKKLKPSCFQIITNKLIHSTSSPFLTQLLKKIIVWLVHCSQMEYVNQINNYAQLSFFNEAILTAMDARIFNAEARATILNMLLLQLPSMPDNQLEKALLVLQKYKTTIPSPESSLQLFQICSINNYGKIRVLSLNMLFELVRYSSTCFQQLKLPVLLAYDPLNNNEAVILTCKLLCLQRLSLKECREIVIPFIEKLFSSSLEDMHFSAFTLLNHLDDLNSLFTDSKDITAEFIQEKALLGLKNKKSSYVDQSLIFIKKIINFDIEVSILEDDLVNILHETAYDWYYPRQKASRLLFDFLIKESEERLLAKLTNYLQWIENTENSTLIRQLINEYYKLMPTSAHGLILHTYLNKLPHNISLAQEIISLDKSWAKQHSKKILYLSLLPENLDRGIKFACVFYEDAEAVQKELIFNYLKEKIRNDQGPVYCNYLNNIVNLLSCEQKEEFLSLAVLLLNKSDNKNEAAELIGRILSSIPESTQYMKCATEIEGILHKWWTKHQRKYSRYPNFDYCRNMIEIIESLAIGISLKHIPSAINLLHATGKESYWKTAYSIARLLSIVDMSDYLNLDWQYESFPQMLKSTPLSKIIEAFCFSYEEKREAFLTVILQRLTVSCGVFFIVNDTLYLQNTEGTITITTAQGIAHSFVQKLTTAYQQSHHTDLQIWQQLALAHPLVLCWKNKRSLTQQQHNSNIITLGFSTSVDNINRKTLKKYSIEKSLETQLLNGKKIQFMTDDVADSTDDAFIALNCDRAEVVFLLQQEVENIHFQQEIAVEIAEALLEGTFVLPEKEIFIAIRKQQNAYSHQVLASDKKQSFNELQLLCANEIIVKYYLCESLGKLGAMGRISARWVAELKQIPVGIWYRQDEAVNQIKLINSFNIEQLSEHPQLLYTGAHIQHCLISCPEHSSITLKRG